MRAYFVIAVLFLCFCNAPAFAGDAPTTVVIQGNHGYVYGSAPATDNTTMTTTTVTTTTQVTTTGYRPGPIAFIINTVKRVDAWIQRNLW